jgi:hypothetical protein
MLDSNGVTDAIGYSRADVLTDVFAADGQNPSTFNAPFVQGSPTFCYALPDYGSGNPSCAGDKTWLELWFVPGNNLADATLLAISNELSLPGS